MKAVRIALFMAVIAVLIISGGCKPAIYFYSFKDQGDFGEDDEEWTYSGVDYAFFDGGVRLHDAIITCPYMFSGDFTETIVFNLNVNDNNRIYFALVLGDGVYDPDSVMGDNHFPMQFERIGALPGTLEQLTITDHDDFPSLIVHYNSPGPVPGINRVGPNILILEKVGDNVTITINDVPIDELELTYYNSDWFCPNIHVMPYFTAFDNYIEIESVQVEYRSGNVLHR